MRTLSTLCGLLLAAAVAADDGRAIPYHALYAPLAAVKQADPAGIVIGTLCAEPTQTGQALPVGLKIELRSGGTSSPLPLDAHGCLELPVRADLPNSDARVWINQPKEAVKLVEAFKMRTPTATRITYGQLMESLPVIERLARQSVPIGGLPTTPPQGVELAWVPGTAQTVTVGTGASAKSWTTDADGRLRIPHDSTLPPATPVVLSALPVALQPYAP